MNELTEEELETLRNLVDFAIADCDTDDEADGATARLESIRAKLG